MPRSSKGPRLWKRPARRKGRKIVKNAVWVIKDGGKHIATGCVAGPAETKPPEAAEKALSKYIAEKYKPARKPRDIEIIDVADVLSIYHADKGDAADEFDDLTGRIDRLNEFWGGKMLSDVNPSTCDEYVKSRPGAGGARRDLECLRAAIRHHAKQNLHHGVVHVTLPPKGEARERWLTRGEAARFIWACWRYRERQTVHIGKNKGHVIETERRPLKHIARFILIGVYTGTRAGAIGSASIERTEGKSFVDLERGVFYRKPIGRRGTKKRQTPAPIPARLLAHMRRWVSRGLIHAHFVEFRGKPVKSVKKGFAQGVKLAKLDTSIGKVTPHTLRHTAATWMMQQAAPEWEAAGYLGMSPEVLREVYGHHHPDFMQGAANAITSKRRVSVAQSVVHLESERERREKSQ